eukprot:351017-Chlamydomonas_euryale.AAC.5
MSEQLLAGWRLGMDDGRASQQILFACGNEGAGGACQNRRQLHGNVIKALAPVAGQLAADAATRMCCHTHISSHACAPPTHAHAPGCHCAQCDGCVLSNHTRLAAPAFLHSAVQQVGTGCCVCVCMCVRVCACVRLWCCLYRVPHQRPPMQQPNSLNADMDEGRSASSASPPDTLLPDRGATHSVAAKSPPQSWQSSGHMSAWSSEATRSSAFLPPSPELCALMR